VTTTIFECWGVPEELVDLEDPVCGITFTTRENAQKMSKNGVIEPIEVPLYSVRAETWEDALIAHHEIQGWEPYVREEDRDD